MMRNIMLIIEYEGTNYSGWQYQENAISVQRIIEEAIQSIEGERIKLIGSGRTDARVHALYQVANFFTNSDIPGYSFKYVLNTKLPGDITIIDSKEVDEDFHSRFSATHKKYKYLVYNGKMPKALYRNFSYHIRKELNLEDMRIASKYLLGTHDFNSFKSSKAVVRSSIRTINAISIEKNKDFVEISIDGDSFLRNMVRIIVGTLVEIGLGKRNRDDIVNILEAKNRKAAGHTAPPQGLFLERVFYD
ncbi:tRNA pseudouridine(38-40) synthase TruA [Paratissierella segnis]|jgi:tRNA pseudouridine38-40 synthase|nr:tRNA pseudouridine(38-40) synthase TruA [Paratissierella segnis]